MTFFDLTTDLNRRLNDKRTEIIASRGTLIVSLIDSIIPSHPHDVLDVAKSNPGILSSHGVTGITILEQMQSAIFDDLEKYAADWYKNPKHR